MSRVVSEETRKRRRIAVRRQWHQKRLEMPFDQQVMAWQPKMEQVARWGVPHYDLEEVMQELSMVLWKCLKGYDERGTTFVAYFTRAMKNKVLNLKKHQGRHNPPKGFTVSMSELQDDISTCIDPDTIFTSRMPWPEALTEYLDEPVELMLESMGLTEGEVEWAVGKLILKLKRSEIAEMTGRPFSEVCKNGIKARIKLVDLKGELQNG